MVNFLQNNWLELINTAILLGLGWYSIKMTKKVEYLKSKLDISASNEKWYIDLQNNTLIKLVEDFNSIAEKLDEMPEYQMNFNSSELLIKYHDSLQTDISAENLNLGKIRLLIEDKDLINAILSYFNILV